MAWPATPSSSQILRDREEAARLLAEKLSKYAAQNPLILAIPRGGVPMGAILADALNGDLDVVLVRKLRDPHNPELAIGSIDEAGRVYMIEHSWSTAMNKGYLMAERKAQADLIQERRACYTPVRTPIDPQKRLVIVVDDGVATGSTFTAALQAVRKSHPKKLVAAIGVAPQDTHRRLRKLADEVVCLLVPDRFQSVEQFYREFPQTSDEEVVRILRHHERQESKDHASPRSHKQSHAHF
jgi:putative phosphoribosyl transferase